MHDCEWIKSDRNADASYTTTVFSAQLFESEDWKVVKRVLNVVIMQRTCSRGSAITDTHGRHTRLSWPAVLGRGRIITVGAGHDFGSPLPLCSLSIHCATFPLHFFFQLPPISLNPPLCHHLWSAVQVCPPSLVPSLQSFCFSAFPCPFVFSPFLLSAQSSLPLSSVTVSTKPIFNL